MVVTAPGCVVTVFVLFSVHDFSLSGNCLAGSPVATVGHAEDRAHTPSRFLNAPEHEAVFYILSVADYAPRSCRYRESGVAPLARRGSS